MTTRARALISMGLLWTAACSDPAELTVDVRTDWKAPTEFETVQTELAPGPVEAAAPSAIRLVTAEATARDDFLRGVRVAELDGVALGRQFLRVTLRDREGGVVSRRVVDLDLRESFALTVVLTRNCRDIACPSADDPEGHTACLDGECVDPRCTPSTPEFCDEARCVADADCAVREGCGGAVCAFGVCLCGAPITDGGAPDAGPPDSGPGCPATETACTDGTDDDCDGLIDCADPDCAGAPCDDGNSCTTGDACSGGVCTGAARSCDDGNPCTDDSCDPVEGCVHSNNTASCNDGNACTTGDRCSGGSCTGSPRSCDDGNPCTTDGCNPSTGCTHGNRANHTTCGAYNLRCCGGSCVDIYTSSSHCGGCGLACTTGLTCSQFTESGRTGASCRACSANAQCPPTGATCWTTATGGVNRCQCQANSHCAAGQACYTGSGNNYCYYP